MTATSFPHNLKMACFCIPIPGIKEINVKRKIQLARTSIVDVIDFMMAQTGINREQATIAFDTIIHYIKKHPAEPFNRLVGYFFSENDSNKSSLN